MFKFFKNKQLLHWELFGKKERRDYKKSLNRNNGDTNLFKNIKNIKDGMLDFETIKKIIDNKEIKIISFDIFDTLLIRSVIKPTDIFYLIDAKLKKEKNIDFIKYRLNAEAELNDHFATLDNIYDYIKVKYKLPNKTISIMKDEELACERNLLSRREDVYDLYQYAIELGKKVICVSDMYLSSYFLKDVLSENGYQKIEKIYVSNEYKARKDDGSLYEVVKKQEGTNHIIHIGDNYISDYEKAISSDILSIYYPSIKDIVFSNTSIYSKVWNINISSDPMCRIVLGYTLNNYFKDIRNVCDDLSVFPDFKALVELGIAPIIFHISNYIANNEEIQKEYSKIFFASRDGYLPKLGYDIYRKYQNILPSEYVYAGRISYFSAKYNSFVEYLDKKHDIIAPFTINDLLNCYIQDKRLIQNVLSSLTPEEKNLNFVKDKDAILSVLKRFSSSLDTYYYEHRKNSREYYSCVFQGIEKIIIFDCGYSGSISSNIGNLINKKVDKIYLWETPKNKEIDTQNETKTFLIMRGNFIPKNLIYEELFSPLEGGCLGFFGNNPLLEDVKFNSFMEQEYDTLYKKTKEYMEKICNLFRSYLSYISIKDIDVLERLLEFAFTFTKSPYGELALLDHIKFPDKVFMKDVESLSYKIQKNLCFNDVYDQTGFNNPKNKICSPSILIQNNFRIGIHIHLYCIYLYNEFIYYLKDFPQSFDLIITICDKEKEFMVYGVFNKNILPNLNKLIVRIVENRGRDVAPWIIGTKDLQMDYDIFCHVQSKISSHFVWGKRWSAYLLKNLLDKTAVTGIINIFASNNSIACIFPKIYKELKEFCINNNISPMGIDGEEIIINNLLKRMHYDVKIAHKDLFFSAGTMLWYRPKALKSLFDIDLKLEEFPTEPIGVGGTIAHAIERLPALVCTLNGYLAKEFTTYDE